jgi:outer membrane autotransporter protein
VNSFVAVAVAALSLGMSGAAFANCALQSNGSTVDCDTSAPNPFTSSINANPTTGGTITIPTTGDTVTVESGAGIVSSGAAIQVRDNSTVTNSGSISTSLVNGYGIWAGDPTNSTSTTAGYGNTLENNGSITTTGSDSVGLFARSYNATTGDTLINNGTIMTSGSISGTSSNASSAGIRTETVAPSTILNTGTVTATGAYNTIGLYGVGGDGVEMDGPGTFTNAKGASVSSANAYGFYGNGAMANGITVDNAGTISGGLAAIFFGPGLSNNTVILEPTSVESGDIDGGSGSVNSSLVFNGLSSNAFANPIPDWQLVTLQNGSVITFTAPSYALQNLDLMPGTSATFSTPQMTISGTVIDDGALTFASPSAISIAATIEGSGTLTQAGAGTLTLTGPNTYRGTTTVETGTLAAGAVDTLPRLTAVTVAAPGTLALDNFNQSIGSLAGAGGVTLGSATLTTGNDNTNTEFSGVISGTGAVDKVGTGTFILSGNNTYTGGTTISAGILELGDGGATGDVVGNDTDDGTLAFDRSNVVTFPGVISGSGSVAQIGTGTTILDAIDPYTGGTTVDAGTLVVGDSTDPTATLSGGGPIYVAPGGTLGGFGSITGDVTNDGTITAGNGTPGYATAAPGSFTINGNVLNNGLIATTQADPTVGTMLNLHGNYAAGPNAKLLTSAAFNAGGPLSNQITDRMLVYGNVTGQTTVQVLNLGGNGAITSFTGSLKSNEGISLIQVTGTSTADAFTLPGGVATGGTPFRYNLNAFGPGSPFGPADPSQSVVESDPLTWDYRLQSAFVDPAGPVAEGADPETPPDALPPGLPPNVRPEVAPQVPAYLSTARGLFQAGLLDIGTLHQRLGEIQDDQTLDREGTGEIFVRAYGGIFNYTTNRSFVDYGYNFDEDYAAVQFGGSYNAINNEYGTLRVGLAGAIGRMWLEPFAVDGMSKALFNTQNFFGIATWQARTGWYVDGVVMGGLFDGRYTTPNDGQTTGMNGTSVAVSVETGFPFPLPWDFSFEPQAQIVWQRLNFQNRTDVDGIDVDLGNPDQVTARVGFQLKRPLQTDDGMRFTPYLKVNVLQGIGSSSDVVLSGVAFGPGNIGTALQVGGGITGTLTRHLSVYGDVSWQSQVGNGGGFRGWIFNGGLRYLFGQPPAPPPALVPAAAPAPAPQPARSYLVFFDWDKATLTDRARQIIREAAENSTRVQYTRIDVNGHTDTSGTPQYNMDLSLRRAHAVAGELMRDGVPAGAISVRGFGQTDLLVPTGPGVREPQNRRVEIILH